MDKLLLLGVIVAALGLFAWERIRADFVALGVLAVLVLTGLVTVEEGFSGFASPAVITVICMFVLSGAMVRTGVADDMAQLVLRSGLRGEIGLSFGVMLMCGAMSAFMNNIAAVAILLPSVFAIAQRSRVPVSKLLLPLSFGSLLGGLTTLIGTPPNLLASEALVRAGHAPFKMFDYTPTGLLVLGIGLLYMPLAARWLIPYRVPSALPDDGPSLRRYVTEVLVPETSALVGRTVPQSGIRTALGLVVARVHRAYGEGQTPAQRPWISLGRYGRDEGNGWYSFVPWPEATLRAGDHLQLEGDPSLLLQRQGPRLLEIVVSRRDDTGESSATGGEGEDAAGSIGEVALAPGSRALGLTIEEAEFGPRYGITVLGLRRSGRQSSERLQQVRIEPGDVLLVRGSDEALHALSRNHDFLVVNRLDHSGRDYGKRWRALAVMLGTILLAASGALHVSIAALLGMLAMVALGCLPVRDLYSHVEWRVVFLIAGMMPLGIAMDEAHTGAGRWLADGLMAAVGGGGPTLVLALVVLLTIALTQVMSNAACVVLIAPIAIATAEALGVSPQPFAMAVAIAASTAFLTPIGHQANVLVYGVGNYRFGDFARVGAPLTLMIVLACVWGVPLVWPFH